MDAKNHAARLRAVVASAVMILGVVTPFAAAGAQGRYVPDGLVLRLKSCTRVVSGPGRVALRNECDRPIHAIACARDSSGCEDADVGPGSEEVLRARTTVEFYACPQRAEPVDMSDNPITSAFAPTYRCLWT